jgi:hypothetical protein
MLPQDLRRLALRRALVKAHAGIGRYTMQLEIGQIAETDLDEGDVQP